MRVPKVVTKVGDPKITGFKDSGAIYSHCKELRYVLWRIWDSKKPMMMCCGLNPSTATHLKLDPTVNRVVSFGKLWGFGGLYMMNLFAFRATEPKDMLAAFEPVGAQNNRFLVECAKNSELVIAAWGNHGIFSGRANEVRRLFNKHKIELTCLGLNANGTPKHPLYLPGNVRPLPYPPIF